MSEQPTRILIVDDSALYRQAVHNSLRHVENVTVVGLAKNGKDALEKVQQLDPDLLTLDVQMPDMNGIEVLRAMRQRKLRPKAIVVSSLTSQGAEITTEALLEGAFDYILKPSGKDATANRQQLQEELALKIQAFRQAESATGIRQQRPSASGNPLTESLAGGSQSNPENPAETASQCQVVVIGTSTGGPAALRAILPKLPAELPVPVLVVQHMAAPFTTSLADRLNELCGLRVVEAAGGMEVQPATVFIAPGGRQMSVVRQGDRLLIRITDDPPEHNCCPAVDYLFRAAASIWQRQILGVILTGMGRDGLQGCQELKAVGSTVYAQDEEGCVVFGMPKAVAQAGLADRVLPLGRMAPAIVRHIKRTRRSCE